MVKYVGFDSLPFPKNPLVVYGNVDAGRTIDIISVRQTTWKISGNIIEMCGYHLFLRRLRPGRSLGGGLKRFDPFFCGNSI